MVFFILSKSSIIWSICEIVPLSFRNCADKSAEIFGNFKSECKKDFFVLCYPVVNFLNFVFVSHSFCFFVINLFTASIRHFILLCTINIQIFTYYFKKFYRSNLLKINELWENTEIFLLGGAFWGGNVRKISLIFMLAGWLFGFFGLSIGWKVGRIFVGAIASSVSRTWKFFW